MARRSREDGPGTWHHVFNRGLGQRTVFETVQIVRYFLSRVALAVRRGEVEVHAFVLMATHFHLLLYSPKGLLSVALKRIEAQFVQWFNRTHGRDGALFRGRFGSRPVKTLAYRRQLVRYIDQNPVVAGLVSTPEAYPHGSASRFLAGRPPPWLSRSWIDEDLRGWTRGHVPWNTAYRLAYSDQKLSEDELFVLERRMLTETSRNDSFDDLISAAPEIVQAKFLHNTRNADGSQPGWPIVGPDAVAQALTDARLEDPDWRLRHAGTNAWHAAELGLLRELCGMNYSELARRVGRTSSSTRRSYLRHLDLIAQEAGYAARFAKIAAQCLRMFGAASHGGRSIESRTHCWDDLP